MGRAIAVLLTTSLLAAALDPAVVDGEILLRGQQFLYSIAAIK